MIGKSSFTTTQSFQKGFQTLNENLVRSNASLTQRLNTQQLEIDLLQEQVNAMDTSTTEFVVASKASLGLDQVNNTSDANKPLSTATTNALATKHPLLEDATNKRLSQNLVQGLVTDLANKHPLITESAKLSKDLVSNYNFADIRTSTTDDTRLSVAITQIPSTSIVTSAAGVTPKVTLDTTLGTFHPKIENADNKRLPQNCVEGLALTYQPLLSTTSKLEKNKIETYYFADIQQAFDVSTDLATALTQIPSSSIITTAAVDQTPAVTLNTALTQIPSSSIITSASGVTPVVTLKTYLETTQPIINSTNKLSTSLIQQLYYSDIQVSSNNSATLATTPTIIKSNDTYLHTDTTTPYFAVGSIIQRDVTLNGINDNVDSSVTLLSWLPAGTWSGFVTVKFFRTSGTGTTWETGGYFTASLSVSGIPTGDFFPSSPTTNIANYQTGRTQVYTTVPCIFRCAQNRGNHTLQLTGNANTSTVSCSLQGQLTLTKIAN